MRGSVTLDFLFSLALLLVTTASLFFVAYTQIENTMIASTQMRAEAMAMAAGSSINHFAAVQPGDGSSMNLTLGGIADPGFAIHINDNDCKATVSQTAGLVTVDVLAYRIESSAPERVTARYPIVAGTTANVTVKCSEGLKLSVTTAGTVVEQL